MSNGLEFTNTRRSTARNKPLSPMESNIMRYIRRAVEYVHGQLELIKQEALK